jgi:hypothetical protein
MNKIKLIIRIALSPVIILYTTAKLLYYILALLISIMVYTIIFSYTDSNHGQFALTKLMVPLTKTHFVYFIGG